jgi:type I restriction enzyme, R subunit
MSLTESIVEDAALTWFGELGYAVGHGPQMAPGEPAAERDSFGEVVLIGRLREAIRQLNPSIPEEAREEALRKVLRVATPSLVKSDEGKPHAGRPFVSLLPKWRSGDLSVTALDESFSLV